jgi:uncharacterized surface protein with fasciclin (FAS1) repeats
MKRVTRGLVAIGAITALAAGAGTAPAQAATGERSLAKVLTSDGNRFDHNGKDFDVVTQAVLAVLDAKPDSAVAVLADGSTRVTAFVPTDTAFRRLGKQLTGTRYDNEKKLFGALVEAAGVDTIETILLYHVVPGSTLTAKKVLKADGVELTTAQGGTVKVNIRGAKSMSIRLQDQDRNARNPRVILSATDINKGNKQVAHGIDRVLRPIDL